MATGTTIVIMNGPTVGIFTYKEHGINVYKIRNSDCGRLIAYFLLAAGISGWISWSSFPA